MDIPLPSPTLAEALRWAGSISTAWSRLRPDVPVPEHQWRSDVEIWLEGAPTATADDQAKLARVMQKLRRQAPREYDVLYRTLLLGEGFDSIAAWLNERAERHGHAQRYETKDAVALFTAGIEFVRTYW